MHPNYKFDQRIKVKKIEFYITNVCNLTCDRCNRYNNHDFKGWQNWADFESEYSKWAQHINIQQIVILGGEPLLNPSILDWVRGINRLWRKPVQILSNGTRLNYVRGLYELLSDKTYTNFVGISWHNTESLEELESNVYEFLAKDARRLSSDEPMAKLFSGANFVYQDSNDVCIPVWIQDHFSDASLQANNGIFSLHNNDPLLAHERCGFVKHNSYHFIRGKLYKCGPVALLPEFDSQHLINMTDEDRGLLNSYKPLCADEFESLGSDFLANINNPIPQCKFCPVNSDFKKILAIRKNS